MAFNIFCPSPDETTFWGENKYSNICASNFVISSGNAIFRLFPSCYAYIYVSFSVLAAFFALAAANAKCLPALSS